MLGRRDVSCIQNLIDLSYDLLVDGASFLFISLLAMSDSWIVCDLDVNDEFFFRPLLFKISRLDNGTRGRGEMGEMGTVGARERKSGTW